MGTEYDGTISSIDQPCPALLEVQRVIAVDYHRLEVLRLKAEDNDGSTMKLSIRLFEKYLGHELHADMRIIKYSTKGHAPAFCDSLRLRTPNYYRRLETAGPGLEDTLEGCRLSHVFQSGSHMTISPVEGDGPSLTFDMSGANKTDGCHKTFMYCCSLYDRSHVLTRTRAKAIFGQDYTHGSVFQSSKKLAQHIVRSFSATIGREMLKSADPIEGHSLLRAYAWVVHGPIEYLPDPNSKYGAIESFFTKPDDAIYRQQNEYRFWVGFSGTPAQSHDATIILPVPPEFVTAVALA